MEGLDADAAGRIACAASDITLVLNREGVVKDLVVSSDSLSKESDLFSWVGRRWVDTVTIESRPKIEQLLRDASPGGSKPSMQWRQVNHPTGGGRLDLPMRYAALSFRPNGQIVALGREMRSLALIQQKLLESQQAIEREYARVRHAEMRYRLLFQTSNEPIVILDSTNLRILEANPAAQSMLAGLAKRLVGKAFPDLFEGANQASAQRLVDSLRAYGRSDVAVIKVGNSKSKVTISGSVFKHEHATHLLLKLTAADDRGHSSLLSGEPTVRAIVDQMPDAFAVTDTDRRILTVNTSFLELAELASLEQARGQSIERWLGRSPAEFNLMHASLKDHGSLRRFATVLRGELGSSEDVELSAVAIEDAQQPAYGFTIRTVSRQAVDLSGQAVLPTINQMTALVGQVPLKNLVRETTDLIERMCIEAALQIVGDNRASAAEMLGLSRQGLYIKLRRYGLGDLGADEPSN